MEITTITVKKDTLQEINQQKDRYNLEHPEARCRSIDEFLRVRLGMK